MPLQDNRFDVIHAEAMVRGLSAMRDPWLLQFNDPDDADLITQVFRLVGFHRLGAARPGRGGFRLADSGAAAGIRQLQRAIRLIQGNPVGGMGVIIILLPRLPGRLDHPELIVYGRNLVNLRRGHVGRGSILVGQNGRMHQQHPE